MKTTIFGLPAGRSEAKPDDSTSLDGGSSVTQMSLLSATLGRPNVSSMDRRGNQDGGQPEKNPPTAGQVSDEAGDDEDALDAGGVAIMACCGHMGPLAV